MKISKVLIFITLFLSLVLLTVSACQNLDSGIKDQETVAEVTEVTGVQNTSSETDDSGITGGISSSENEDVEEPGYLDFYEGLHITGRVVDVDIENYRLEITGAVEKELSLTFDEVKSLPSERVYSELDCPGFFTDKGYWTGIKILDLLDMAGLNEDAKNVEFISVDDSYSKILSLETLQGEGFLVAYEFDDKEFSKYHGFPLRVVAKGQPGSVWVKWLGKIVVLTE